MAQDGTVFVNLALLEDVDDVAGCSAVLALNGERSSLASWLAARS